MPRMDDCQRHESTTSRGQDSHRLREGLHPRGIVPFDTLVELGSMAACKEKGLVCSEGKDYVMTDGDIVLFRFNV